MKKLRRVSLLAGVLSAFVSQNSVLFATTGVNQNSSDGQIGGLSENSKEPETKILPGEERSLKERLAEAEKKLLPNGWDSSDPIKSGVDMVRNAVLFLLETPSSRMVSALRRTGNLVIAIPKKTKKFGIISSFSTENYEIVKSGKFSKPELRRYCKDIILDFVKECGKVPKQAEVWVSNGGIFSNPSLKAAGEQYLSDKIDDVIINLQPLLDEIGITSKEV